MTEVPLNENDARILSRLETHGELHSGQLRRLTGLTSGQVSHSTRKLTADGHLKCIGQDKDASTPGSPPNVFRLTGSGRTLCQDGTVDALLSLVEGGEEQPRLEEEVITLRERVDRVESMAEMDALRNAVDSAEMAAEDRDDIEQSLEDLASQLDTTKAHVWAALDVLSTVVADRAEGVDSEVVDAAIQQAIARRKA